jgi:ABC-type sugar transport system ATPase subunit
VELRGVRKHFAGAVALAGVDLELRAGEVHALVGENGAGKSTLMRVLAGLHGDYRGEIRVGGGPARLASPARAAALGIALVHQELSLVPEMSVAENVFLGREPQGRLPGLVDFRAMERGAEALLAELGVRLPVREKVARLGAGARQLVEIAKGLSQEPRILILDEPSSSLSRAETGELLARVRALRARGTAVVYVSHKLDEVLAVADRITVLRDGARVASRPVAEWSEEALVRAMVGRDLKRLYPRTRPAPGEVVLRVEGLARPGRFRGVTFSLRRGEVLGLAGLVGAGRSDLAQALFGLPPAKSGAIALGGAPVRIRAPADAMALGIALVPEDRLRQGLVPRLSVRENVSLASLGALSRLQWMAAGRERAAVAGIAGRVGLAPGATELPVRRLSGGNQQKVVVARWMLRRPRILILDEPTRGVDVGAKAEIHALVDRLAGEGAAVLLVSSDLPEVLGMSDRVLVMRQGRIAAELSREKASEESVLAAATGVADPGARAG